MQSHRWWLPTLPDFVMGALILFLFVLSGKGWGLLLSDGDTGWHIRTGEWIIAHREVPYADLFSFTKPGAPWFAWEWLSDVLFALLHQIGGLPLVAFFAAFILVLTSILLLRFLMWRGTSPLVAFALVMLGAGGSTMHYLARPHIFTLLFLMIAIWLLEAERRQPSPQIWLLVPLTFLWTNLHGGWPALFVLLAVHCVVHVFQRDKIWRKDALLVAACLIATLINPYGWELHRHVIAYLQSDWIRESVDEFQSPKFRAENLLQFELLLLAGLAAAGRRFRSTPAEAILVVIWAHLSLGAVRHAPIFILIAVPVLADEISALLRQFWSEAKKSSLAGVFRQLDTDLAPRFAANSIWLLLLPVFIWFGSRSAWPLDFPATRFPTLAFAAERPQMEGKRVFTSDQWGDYLLYHSWPKTMAYIDGRSDFYGRQSGEESLRIASGAAGWEEDLARWSIDRALLPPGAPLAVAMRRAGWQVLYSDSLAVLLLRPAALSVPKENRP